MPACAAEKSEPDSTSPPVPGIERAITFAPDELVLLRADAGHKIWNVLTNEQRRRVDVLQRPPRTLDQ